ncbi:hypothetical protein NQZ68_038771, partial [Dissostichus eleginoides]
GRRLAQDLLACNWSLRTSLSVLSALIGQQALQVRYVSVRDTERDSERAESPISFKNTPRYRSLFRI